MGKDTLLYVEYPSSCDLSEVPDAILTIPFVTCFLSVSMLFNVGIRVKELDKTFVNSIPAIKKAYKRMFPYLRLNFDVVSDAVVDCTYVSGSKKSLFFTGGMDATSALINVVDEHPLLINIWGGDIGIADAASHKGLERYIDKTCRSLHLDYAFIKSNCREMFNEPKVTKACALKILPWHNHGWWASIAHILSMSGLIAPMMYVNKIGTHCIASSYSAKDKTFDANNDTLLGSIKFGSCRIVGVDSCMERNDKAKRIVDYCNATNATFELKVCWYRRASKNCSHCEKCYRTILEIYANHGDPNDFGFTVTPQTYLDIRDFLRKNYVNKGYWKPIQERFRQECDYWKTVPEIAWILDFRFNQAQAIKNKAIYVLKKFV